LELVTIILNYCAALMAFHEDSNIDNPYPVVLCVTDNISAKNWTMHTSKKSIIGRALVRFFFGLLIGSRVGIFAKWISTLHNKIADVSLGTRQLTLQLILHIMISRNSNRTTRN